MTRPRTIRHCSRALVLVGVATVPASADGSVPALAPPPLMVDAQVIAQGVIEFDDSPIVWSVSAASLPPNTEADIDADMCGFLHVTGGMLDVDVNDELFRLAAGEAMMLRPGDDAGLSVSGLETVTGWQIVLADSDDGDAAPTGDPFLPGAGLRDVELLRDVLEPGDVLDVADRELPVLVLATVGPLIAGAAGGEGSALSTGQAAVFDTAFVVSNTGDQQASVIVAVIGERIAEDASLPTTTTPPTTVAPTTAAPTTTTAPTATSGSTATTAVTTTVPADTDGDGLTDEEENNFTATDPANPDSDGDGLSDGEEVTGSGTNPNDADTDDDGLDDYIELFGQNTDPFTPDSDGDTIPDGDEVNVHFTDPLLTDTDSDDVNDFQEIANHGTDPLIADTDGDSFTDGIELSGGFDPLDPANHP